MTQDPGLRTAPHPRRRRRARSLTLRPSTETDAFAGIVLIFASEQPVHEWTASISRARVAQQLRNSFAIGFIHRPKKIFMVAQLTPLRLSRDGIHHHDDHAGDWLLWGRSLPL